MDSVVTVESWELGCSSYQGLNSVTEVQTIEILKLYFSDELDTSHTE